MVCSIDLNGSNGVGELSSPTEGIFNLVSFTLALDRQFSESRHLICTKGKGKGLLS